VVTGELLDDPREGGGPGGTPLLLMEIEFPVAHPEHPRLLWATAAYEVEVPGDVGGRHVEELKKGASVMVAGQLSERWTLQDGRWSRRSGSSAARRSTRLSLCRRFDHRQDQYRYSVSSLTERSSSR
jgi:hypothetical protein